MKRLFGAALLLSLGGLVWVTASSTGQVFAPTLPTVKYEEAASKPPRGISHEAIASYLGRYMTEVPSAKLTRISKLILRLSHQYRFHPGLILSIIRVESNFRPWAMSSRGALGLMQVMPETGEWLAQRMGLTWKGPVMLLDEEINLQMGVKYLAFLRDRYGGNLMRTLDAYNRGPAKVDTEETVPGGREYYKKVREYYPKFAHL